MRLYKPVCAVLVAILSALVGVMAMSPQVFAAGSASLYLSPVSGSLQKGQSVAVNVYENSGSDTINAVQANLTYSTSQLQYVSFSDSPAFSVEAEDPSGNTGSLHFARGVLKGTTSQDNQVTGNQLVVTVRFTVVASSGTAHVNFDSGSAVLRSNDNGQETLSITNGTYNLVAPATTGTTPKSTTTTKQVSEPSPIYYATTPAPSKSPTSPKSGTLTISNLKVNSSDSSSNTVITWVTNKPASSVVSYGADQKHLVTTSDGALVTSHSVSLPSNLLHAGGNYYYYVTSVDAAGDAVSSQLLPFVAAGGVATNSGMNVTSFVHTAAAVTGIIVVVACAIIIFRKVQKSLAASQELGRHFPVMPNQNSDTQNVIHSTSSNSANGPTVMPGTTINAPPNQPPEIKKN